MKATSSTKVLICIEWFDPAYRAGGPIRSIANLVSSFTTNIQYFVFCGDADLNNEPLAVEKNSWIDYNLHTKVFYASKRQLKNKFDEICRTIQPDIIYINGLYSIPFNVIPLLFGKSYKKVVAPRGMLQGGALQQKQWKKKFFFTFWKLLKLQNKVEFHATNVIEKEAIQHFFNRDVQITIAENYPRLFEFHSPENKQKGTLSLLSIALVSPMKNHLLVLQALLKCSYTIHYTIVGPIKDDQYWQLCTSLIEKMPNNIQVDYRGDVSPNCVEDILKNADVFILPSESENYAHAIIEAMSAGCPVITSHHTPWNNLSNQCAGINVELNDHEILNAINSFAVMDSNAFKHWSEQTHEFILNNILLSKIDEQYKKLFQFNN